MGRWTPSVLPEVPRYVPPVDIGSALQSLAGGLSDGFARRDRNARDQAEADRYYDAENNRRIERAQDRARQQQQDKIAAEDRQRRLEGDYLRTRSTARDEGYVPTAEAEGRRSGYRNLQGAVGEYGAAFDGIGSALLSASDNAPTMDLTKPDGTREGLMFDPTQTREVRDDQRAMARDRVRDSMKPTPRDPIQDELTTYEGKLKIDQKYRVNDFKPERPSGGRGGGGSGSANDPRIAVADKMYDNADRVVARVEKMEPKRPTFDTFKGMPSPAGDPTNPDYPAFRADSLAKEGVYGQQHGAWQKKMNAAQQAAQRWFTIGDALASEVVGAKGGESVFTQQQINAQREVAEATKRLQNTLAATRGDPEAEKEARQRYFDDVNGINAKYGIRPKPED